MFRLIMIKCAQEYRTVIKMFVGVALLLDVELGSVDCAMAPITWEMASRISREGATSVLGLSGPDGDDMQMKVRE